ncbi:DUF3592 domain-containing protein [Arthrobacter bambusae]|uniref:DUF3592 domain-containing protein n=1 Tax=Arthrobacter bambusae TaxID=1338426 RepID=A0AAW8D5F2_9MICC|nr:DUF3592 domain-containing protein [Arthrobacter bambusae]MDP9903098.1 hypothetical protein [Arthrobacter bambusae]MDQ0128908.1 hypothetical protein [Arthrobacter bambusae]MDQ0180249.1 hypothetical protein [Arthrobacter bambusae]
MKETPGNDAPTQQVGKETQDTLSPEVSGDGYAWFVALPDGLRLKASPYLENLPPVWLGSSLRRSMLLAITFFALAITAVVIVAGFGLIAALAPFTAGSVRTTGQVTSQHPYYYKHSDQCTLGITFALSGQHQNTTVETGKLCKASLPLGTQVQLALNPDNPNDVAVLGHGFTREGAWQGVVIMGLVAITLLVGFLLARVRRYRHAKRLFYHGTRWHELSPTVHAVSRNGSSTWLRLVAQDTMENTRIFTMAFHGRLHWRKLRPGDPLELALLADGGAYAVVTVKGEERLYLARLSVPDNFQLRAMGL